MKKLTTATLSTFGLLGLVGFAQVGCSASLESYVRAGEQRPVEGVDQPTSSNPNGIKFSPGSNQVLGSQLKARVSITPTNRTVQGSALKATFSMQQSRPN